MGEVVPIERRRNRQAPLLPLPAEWLDALASRVADVLAERLALESGRSPWLTRAAAADYLGIPSARLDEGPNGAGAQVGRAGLLQPRGARRLADRVRPRGPPLEPATSA